MAKGFGYIPDIPAVEDFTVNSIDNKLLPKNLLAAGKGGGKLPRHVDNRKWCSPVDDQGELGSCGPTAALSMFEYMENRAFGNYIDGSRLFTYWNTRNIMGAQYLDVDSGVYNRSVMKAIVKVGVIPETLWPYDISTFANLPTTDMFLNKQPYNALSYVRLDTSYGRQYVDRIRTFLNNGYALLTGLAVYDNIFNITKQNPVLEYPVPGVDKEAGGHAVMIAGYDDDMPTKTGNGAFLIKNSWGAEWGDNGYFWLPYKYFENGIALDTWTITGIGYVDSKQFD